MRTCIAFILATFAAVAVAGAQSVAESLLPKQSTVVIDAIDGRNIGSLARAAKVPMGLEALAPLPQKFSIQTAGRRLRDVLNLLVAADPRYEWRDVDGVVVIRPSRAWSSGESTLQRPVRALSLRHVDASDVITTIGRMVGHTETSGSVPDTHAFSVDVADGSTFLEALNAMVRAHGSLAWTVARTDGRDPTFVATIMVFSGSAGMGFSVRAGSALTSEPIVAERSERENAPGSRVEWDRVVPLRPNGLPFEASLVGPGLVADLARAVRMPMGIESIATVPVNPRADYVDRPIVTLSGMTLVQALAQLTALDPRYQWRDMSGVIVFRPVAAWTNTKNPLFRRIEAFRLKDAVLRDVVKALNSRLGVEGSVELTDARRFSIDAPAGPVLNALNAIVRSHGQLYWHWEDSDSVDRKWHPGMAHRLTLGFMSGTGIGYLVP